MTLLLKFKGEEMILTTPRGEEVAKVKAKRGEKASQMVERLEEKYKARILY